MKRLSRRDVLKSGIAVPAAAAAGAPALSISFHAGNTTYTGAVNRDRIELRRSGGARGAGGRGDEPERWAAPGSAEAVEEAEVVRAGWRRLRSSGV